jgi:hypothetical protein
MVQTGFYWIGVAMAVACLSLAFAGNTEFVARFESAHIPIKWATGLFAIGAFLAAELCDSDFATSTRPSPEMLQQELFQEQEV